MRIAASLASALLACGAAAQEPLPFSYEPAEAVLQNPQPSVARVASIRQGELVAERAAAGEARRAKVMKMTWLDLRLRLAYDENAGAPGEVRYDALHKAGAVRDPGLFSSRWGVPVTGGWVLWCETGDSERCARALADILYVRMVRLDRMREADRLFAAALARYKDRDARPPLPEEARKYRVQAEFALDQKKLDEAAERYTRAVVAARWWADGYFNLALIQAERQYYSEAIRIMRRFIALEEGTPDARRAQDMIYRWEAQLPPEAREP